MRLYQGSRPANDEAGASLILAIAFLVVVGVICMATLSMITSGLNNRKSLDATRNQEYAADGAIEYAIATVRNADNLGPSQSSCDSTKPKNTPDANTFNYSPDGTTNIRVTCVNVPTLTFGTTLLERNVVFNACVESGVDCDSTNSIIRAQVTFRGQGGGSNFVTTSTWVQSWSVNR